MTDFPRLSTEAEPVESLRSWLSQRPFEWGPALATRAAFRSLPWAIGYSSPIWIERYSLPLFHALFIAWSTTTNPIKGHKHAAELSANLLYPAAIHPEPEAYFASAMRHIDLAIYAKGKIEKVDHSVRAVLALNNLTNARIEVRPIENFIWDSISEDINFFTSRRLSNNERSRSLMRNKFIEDDKFPEWNDRLIKAFYHLLQADSSFKLWIDWVKTVIRYRNVNFFAPGTSADALVRDRQVQSAIVHEVSNAFWTREPSVVNNDVAEIVANAAKALAPEVAAVAEVPPQNDNAIAFQANSSGKIELVDLQHYQALRDDEDTKDRYAECMAMARDVLHRCEGSNAAGRLLDMLRNYLSAAGASVAELRPSLFVQRGERLRQEIAAYQLHDTLLPPLADDILLDLRTWQAAHNMLVGLDPALMARDTALFGPNDRIADVPPKEIREIAVDAERSGLLAQNVVSIIVEAADLAPEIPDPRNRRTIWSFETGRNLVIEAFNVALRHPGKSLVGAVISGAAISTLGAAGTVVSLTAGSMPAAKFLLRHRQWIETRLGDTPTWKGLFESLCEWLDKNTPFGRGD